MSWFQKLKQKLEALSMTWSLVEVCGWNWGQGRHQSSPENPVFTLFSSRREHTKSKWNSQILIDVIPILRISGMLSLLHMVVPLVINMDLVVST